MYRQSNTLKDYKPLNLFEWSAAGQMANNVFKIAASLVSLNLHQDLITPARLQQRLQLDWMSHADTHKILDKSRGLRQI